MVGARATAGSFWRRAVERMARIAACATLTAMPVAAQTFADLDFDDARFAVPPEAAPWLDWNEAAPGWNHSAGEGTGQVSYLTGALGFAQSYVLLDVPHSPFGEASDLFALGMRSGRSVASLPGSYTEAFVSQTGRVPSDAASLVLLASSEHFVVMLDGEAVPMLNVGLGPPGAGLSPFLWAGDISSFAGREAELRIIDTFPGGEGGFSSDALVIDEVRMLPVPEPSTAAMLAGGLLWMGMIRKGRRATEAALRSHVR